MEQGSQPPTSFTASPGMTVPIPTNPLGFFQLFIPYEFFFFFYGRNKRLRTLPASQMAKPSAYKWSGTNVIDIAHYLDIVLWMGIIELPEMWMYWARNKTFSVCISPDNGMKMIRGDPKILSYVQRKGNTQGLHGQADHHKACAGFHPG